MDREFSSHQEAANDLLAMRERVYTRLEEIGAALVRARANVDANRDLIAKLEGNQLRLEEVYEQLSQQADLRDDAAAEAEQLLKDSQPENLLLH